MNKKITIDYQEFSNIEELEQADAQLLRSAIQATALAHAPYSDFHVGAAVRFANGEILSASNQENEASPSGLCAERSALFYAFSKYPDIPITAIAVAAKRGTGCKNPDGTQELIYTEEPTRPCGACIQVMLDAQKRAGKPIKVILGSARKIEVISSVRDLIPFAFDNLNKQQG